FDGVQVNFRDFPQVYDEYVRLAGNEVKHPAWGVGLKDFLNAVVSGQHPLSETYQMRGSAESKLAFISKAVSDYRKIAQREILADPRFPEFHDYIRTLKAEQMQRRMPVLP